LKCAKCSETVSDVDTFCSSCGCFLKEQQFERKREDHSSYEAEVKAAEQGAERAIVACPQCGQKLSVPKYQRALRITCPQCRNVFTCDFQGGG